MKCLIKDFYSEVLCDVVIQGLKHKGMSEFQTCL